MSLKSRLTREYLLSRKVFGLTVVVALLLGIGCLLIAATVTRMGTVPDVILFGIGTSLVASAFFVFLTASRDKLGIRFIGIGLQNAFYDRGGEFSNDNWDDLLRSARRELRILGVANHGYIRPGNVAETERSLNMILKKKVQVEIAWLDPSDRRAELRTEEEGRRGTRQDTLTSMEWFLTFRGRLDDDMQQRLDLRVYRLTPSCGIIWIDDYLIVTNYLSSETNRSAPGLVLSHDSGVLRSILTWHRPSHFGPPLAKKYIDHYRHVITQSDLLDSAKFDSIRAAIPELPPNKVSEADLA